MQILKFIGNETPKIKIIKLNNIELKYDDEGNFLNTFKINGKSYGMGIAKINIIFEPMEINKIEIFANKKCIPQKELEELQKIENIEIYEKI